MEEKRLPSNIRAELIGKAASLRGRPETIRAAVGSTRLLMSQADDEELESNWRDQSFWASMARRWHERGLDHRTKEEAKRHCSRVCKALGARRS